MSGRFFDISVTLKSGMARWPGDPAVKISKTRHRGKSGSCAVSEIHMSAHTGTHMDAPCHYLRGAKGIDRMPLDAVMGPARVIEVKSPVSVCLADIKKYKISRGERIIFKTNNSLKSWKKKSFDENFVYLSPEAADFLAARRVRCVGVDYLSVGGRDESGAAVHRTLLKAGIWIIEGLNLSGIKAGRYDLICLPLKLHLGDGAPARAVLHRRSLR